MRQLKIKRLEEWANRRFNYKIIVDGEEQFEIANGQEKILTVDSGATIQAKLMWCGSEKISLTTDQGELKEIIVKANKGPNIWFPFFALVILILTGLVNLVYPDNEAKVFMTSVMLSIIFYALCLLSIWRNKFLDLELITD